VIEFTFHKKSHIKEIRYYFSIKWFIIIPRNIFLNSFLTFTEKSNITWEIYYLLIFIHMVVPIKAKRKGRTGKRKFWEEKKILNGTDECLTLLIWYLLLWVKVHEADLGLPDYSSGCCCHCSSRFTSIFTHFQGTSKNISTRTPIVFFQFSPFVR
jgi:hypothetical protein